MTQHEHLRHLTTEQLSAYLDKQLTPQEQAAFDAHISTCPQCQQALAELRSTVTLLRAMPRVDVPRSFTLPTPIRPVPLQAARVNTEPPRRQPVPHYRMRRAVQAVSTLAAVLGFLFILSGFLTSVHFTSGGGATSASPAFTSQDTQPTKSTAAAAEQPGRGTPNVGKVNGSPTKTPIPARSTPAATPATNTGSPPPADQTPTFPPALDPGRSEGRFSLGLLLLLFGIIGLLTTRRRRVLRY